MSYYRLDEDTDMNGNVLLRIARSHLASQLPFAFGFPLYSSIMQSMQSGKIPFPTDKDTHVGNHAVVAMGYSDSVTVKNAEGNTTKGALLIQNSWSKDWGDNGFGWLPYAFVTQGLAQDFWSLTQADWFDGSKFQIS